MSTEDKFNPLLLLNEARVVELEDAFAVSEDDLTATVQCARCGATVLGWGEAVAVEGDEWECFPCFDRCNAEDDAMAEKLKAEGKL